MHDATGAPRMTGRFGDGPSETADSGAIYSYPYPGELLQPNTSTTPATASLVAHPGGWREGAAFYREWLNSVGTERHQLNWFLHHTHSKGSCWFPSPTAVAASKKSGVGMKSFTEMVDYSYNTEVDMIECAMWWEMPEKLWSTTAPMVSLGSERTLAAQQRWQKASGRCRRLAGACSCT